MTETEKMELEEEIREDARQFILDSIDAGVDVPTILNDLSSFYDGDLIDLF